MEMLELGSFCEEITALSFLPLNFHLELFKPHCLSHPVRYHIFPDRLTEWLPLPEPCLPARACAHSTPAASQRGEWHHPLHKSFEKNTHDILSQWK